MAANMLWFWAGAGLSWIVIPYVKLLAKRRKEFSTLLHDGGDLNAAKQGIAQLVHAIKQMDAAEVKTIVISVEKYDTEDSFVGFGGRAGNIAHAIEVVCEQLALRVPNIAEQERE